MTTFWVKGTSFYEIKTKEQVLEFLDTKIKSYNEDPDKRWITTWNNYLNRIRLFYRWLLNHSNCLENENWETPEFVKIKNKKSKRLSPYLESEIWESDLKQGNYHDVDTAALIAKNVSREFLEGYPEIVRLVNKITSS